MKTYSKILFILGDIHGDFVALNYFINKQIRQSRRLRAIASQSETEVSILQCGDFAFFWPGENNSTAIKNRVDFLKNEHVKIYWCGGNHEDWDTLDRLFLENDGEKESGIKEVAADVYFARFGATLDLSSEIRILFAGGAESHDIEEREAGLSWWPQESISAGDMARLVTIPNIDWVISHTAPYYFDVSTKRQHDPEPSRQKLNRVFDIYHPKKWFFGHFHHYCHGNWHGCEWEGLNYLGGHGKSWQQICL